MTKGQALLILELSESKSFDHYAITDASENKIFELNQLFLKNQLLPSLIKSRIKKLQQIEEAASLLLEKQTDKSISSFENEELTGLIENSENLLALVNNFENAKRKPLLVLANSYSTKQSIAALKTLEALCRLYATEYMRHYLNNYEEPELRVKISDTIDAVQLIKELKEQEPFERAVTVQREYCRQKKILEMLSVS